MEENKCPYCGFQLEENGIPNDAGLEGDSYYYLWTCKNCEEDFTQWYDLVWSENTKD